MVRPPQPDGCWSEGQIALEEARFCVECELIFAGTFRCPRCESGWSGPSRGGYRTRRPQSQRL